MERYTKILKTTLGHHVTPTRLTAIRKTEQSKCQQRCGSPCLKPSCRNNPNTVESRVAVPPTAKHEPAAPLLHVGAKERRAEFGADACPPMFTAAFSQSPQAETTLCPSTDVVRPYSGASGGLARRGILTPATTERNLSEISQSPRDKHCAILFI